LSLWHTLWRLHHNASGYTFVEPLSSELTKKEYYSRISRLTNSGVVARKHGKYLLTSFGIVVYQAQKLIGKAVENRWKLVAIDSIGSLSLYERNRIIDTLMKATMV
jgi:hypothetical protein